MAFPFVISSLLGLAWAQTTTVNVPFLGYDEFPIAASVITASPESTVIALACPPDAEECGLFPHHIMTYGPSVYHVDMMFPGDNDFTATQDCSITSSKAVCKESAAGTSANFPGSSTVTYEKGGDEGEVTTFPVTITAGLDKLVASASASPTPTGSYKETTSAGGSANATLATSTRTSASSGSEGTAAAPAQNTGAAIKNVVMNIGVVGAAGGLFAGFLM